MSISSWWALFALGVVLVVGGMWLISQGRGSETVGKVVVPFLNISIGKATTSLVLVVFGVAAAIYSLTEIRSDKKTEPPKATISEVTHIDGQPASPTFEDTSAKSDKANMAAVGKWLSGYFDARIEVDGGTDHDLRPGDYLVAIPDRKKAADLPAENLGNLEDEATALLKVVRAYPHSGVTQLESYSYEAAFRNVPDDAPAKELFDRVAPVRVGEAVVAIPHAEARARAQVEALDARAADAKSREERRILYEQVIEEADAFLDDYPTGYFAGATLFQRGDAELSLRECGTARRTFTAFLNRYPFHPSAPGARERVKKAERCA